MVVYFFGILFFNHKNQRINRTQIGKTVIDCINVFPGPQTEIKSCKHEQNVDGEIFPCLPWSPFYVERVVNQAACHSVPVNLSGGNYLLKFATSFKPSAENYRSERHYPKH